MDEKTLRNWRLTEEIWVVKPTTYSPSYRGFEPNEWRSFSATEMVIKT